MRQGLGGQHETQDGENQSFHGFLLEEALRHEDGHSGYEDHDRAQGVDLGFEPQADHGVDAQGQDLEGRPGGEKADDDVVDGQGEAQEPPGQHGGKDHGQDHVAKNLVLAGPQVRAASTTCGSKPSSRP
jgi:hypothetical protein